MVDYNEEYFFLKLSSSLKYKNPNFDLWRNLHTSGPSEIPESPIDLYVIPPIAGYSIGDYDSFNGGFDYVFSERVKNVIERLNPVNTQFLATNIHKGKKIYDGYFILHCYHRISCMDKKNSFWTKSNISKPEKEVLSIDKLVLDDSEIKNLPVSERLIFKVKECTLYILFHKSIVDEIKKLPRAKGLSFVAVKDWIEK